MPFELVNMETSDSTDQLRLALVGLEQSGKSRLAATCRKPALLLDFDGKKASIAKTPGLHAVSFKEVPYPHMPVTYSDSLDILTQIEKSTDLSQVNQKFNLGLDIKSETMLKTVIVDSGFSFGRAIMSYILYTNKDLRVTVNIGGKLEIHTPKSWAAWGAETNALENYLLRLFALGLDVIFILHEAAEESNDSTEKDPKFTGKQTVYPVRYKNLLKYFNEVWRVTRTDKGEPKVITVPEFYFATAGTTMKLDASERPNIEAMIAKHKASK